MTAARFAGFALLLCTLAACMSPAARHTAALIPHLGIYQGGFDSALTEDPEDDLNFNPCDPAASPCAQHQAPLTDIVLELYLRSDGQVGLEFYRTLADRDSGQTLDLLGQGCGTRLGPQSALDRLEGNASGSWTATFPLTTENSLCLGKLRPTSTHHLRVELHQGDDKRFVRVVIDRRVTDANYLYVVENNVKRRVKIDLANTIGEGRRAQYRVCIEDDLGEYERCVLTDREVESFILPVPLPGGAAIGYTWWEELRPKLRRTRGLYSLEQYSGRFESIADSAH